MERVAREGRPHLVTVLGQAGVGKSRLLSELTSTLAESDDPPTIRRGQCPPYGAGIAYWALAEVLIDEFEIRDIDPPETAWGKLRAGVTELMAELGDEEAGDRNAALLAIPLGLDPPEDLRPIRGGPPADARGALLRRPRGGGGDRPPPLPGPRDRRHPLG